MCFGDYFQGHLAHRLAAAAAATKIWKIANCLVIPIRIENHCPIPYRVPWAESAPGLVALVRLAEAHVPVPVALNHASVVHHEEVHLEVVGARTPHLVVLWKQKRFFFYF